MNEGTNDKLSGKAKEMGGKVEQGAGDLLGDKELKGRGVADEAEGKGEGLLGKAKDALGNAGKTVKGAADSVGDKVKDATHNHDTDPHTHK